jgi:hypothetical protein
MGQVRLIPRSKTKYINKILGLFGSSIIAYWPLNERAGSVAFDLSGNGRNGAYTGVDLGRNGIGDRQTCPYFDGANDYLDIYSANLAAAFNGNEGSFLVWLEVRNPSIWTDGIGRIAARLRADGNNYVQLDKNTLINSWRGLYVAGSVIKQMSVTYSNGAFFNCAITWSKSDDSVKIYLNGVQALSTLHSLGVWSGSLVSGSTVIGASSTTPGSPWCGYLAHALLLNRAATPAEVLQAGVL